MSAKHGVHVIFYVSKSKCWPLSQSQLTQLLCFLLYRQTTLDDDARTSTAKYRSPTSVIDSDT
jgi:hypothetical protein